MTKKTTTKKTIYNKIKSKTKTIYNRVCMICCLTSIQREISFRFIFWKNTENTRYIFKTMNQQIFLFLSSHLSSLISFSPVLSISGPTPPLNNTNTNGEIMSYYFISVITNIDWLSRYSLVSLTNDIQTLDCPIQFLNFRTNFIFILDRSTQ